MQVLKKPLIAFTVTLILLVLSNRFTFRKDLTADKRHSLSETTITLLKNLESPIRIDVFLSGDLPGLYRDFSEELDVFLGQLQFYSNQLIIQYHDPFEIGTNEQVIQEMQRYGMTPEIVIENKDGQRSETIVFPWMIVNHAEVSERISLLEKQLGDTDRDKITRSIQQMEYLVIDGIQKTILVEKSNLAVLTSHQTSENIKLADLLQSLKSYYNLGAFDLKNKEVTPMQSLENLKRFDVLMISNPNEAFSQEEKYILDQYALQGGGILWLVNGIGIDRDSLFNNSGTTYGFPLELNLDDYFFNQGIRLNKALVQDLYCAPLVLAMGDQNDTQFIPYPWPYYPLPRPKSNLIGQAVGPVLVQFGSPLDSIESNLNKEILLETSAFTKTSGVPTLLSLAQASQKIKPNEFNEPSKILGMLLYGTQKSLFTNKIKPFEYSNHQEKGELKTIVFGDGNMGENQIDKGAPLQLGFDKWTNNFYKNKQFLMNSIHYLSGNQQGLMIRQKEWEFSYLDPQKIESKGMLWKIIMLLSPILITLSFGWMNQRRRSKHLSR
jgi:gliding-associated putative ABC transporter substrate-binding component GldG